MLYIKQRKFKKSTFIAILVSICIVFVSASPALAAVGLNVNYPSYDLLSGENLYYGYMNNTSAGSLILVESPVGTKGLRISRTGQVEVSRICDEGGSNCHDVSTGWASLGGSDGYIGDVQTHTAGGQLNMGTNAIASLASTNLNLQGTGGGYVEVKSNNSASGLRIVDYNSTAWGNIDTNSGYMAIGYNNDDGPIFIDDSDEIGIGDSSPGSALDVDGTMSIGSNLTGGTDALIMHNMDIGGVNWLQISDPGEGIQWNGGASTVNLYVVDDASDNILRTNYNFDANGSVAVGAIDWQSKLVVDGWIGRTAHNNGALAGSYNNVAANSTATNPIYTIGTAYLPAATTLGNMYGIGYTHTNASFIPATVGGATGWGMYVAADGDARIYLNGGNGGAYFAGNTSIGTTDPAGYRLRVAGGNMLVEDQLHLGANNAYIEACDSCSSYGTVKGPNFESSGGIVVEGGDGYGLTVLAGGATIYGNVGINTAKRSDTYRLSMGGHIHMNNQSLNYTGQLHFNDNVRFVDNGVSWLRFRWGDTGAGGIQLWNGSNQRQGYIYGSGDNRNFGLLDGDGSWAVRIDSGDGTAIDADAMVYYYVNGVEKVRFARIDAGTNGPMQITTPSGYLGLGPYNSGWAHFITGNPRFYFNKGMAVNYIGSYTVDMSLQAPYGSTRMTISMGTTQATGGLVSIGTTNAAGYRLRVAGNFLLTQNLEGSTLQAANIISTWMICGYADRGVAECFSDLRLKKNIETIDNPIEKLKKLRGVYFNWREDNDEFYNFGNERGIGLIAQETEEVLPEVVKEDSNGYKTMNYSKLTGFLIEVNKDQQERIKELKERIERLKAR